MNQPHPHAALMMLYAQDAAETDKPWEMWEYRGTTRSDWEALSDHPSWHKRCGYRRKPQTIIVNGVEVPEPLRKAPKLHEKFFLVNPASRALFNEYFWTGHEYEWLNKGLVHLTEEAAIVHAKAMLAAERQGASGVDSGFWMGERLGIYKAPQQEPALFVSAKQLTDLADPSCPTEGGYLPARKTRAGRFTQPLYAAPLSVPLSDDELVELGRSESELPPWGARSTRADYLRAVRAVLAASGK